MSGPRLVVREFSVGPCLAPIVRGDKVQGMTHIRKQCLNRVARNIPCHVLLKEPLASHFGRAKKLLLFLAQEPLINAWAQYSIARLCFLMNGALERFRQHV